MTLGAVHWLAKALMSHGAGRLRRTRPEWAEAMASEAADIPTGGEYLRWAAGCAVASYRSPGALGPALYPAALSVGIALMAAYQWSADESFRTLAVLGLIGGALGGLEPRRALISGGATGLVVAAVNGFETITGLRPPYETTAHTLIHDARWLLLIAPALIAATLGAYAGRKLKSVWSPAL